MSLQAKGSVCPIAACIVGLLLAAPVAAEPRETLDQSGASIESPSPADTAYKEKRAGLRIGNWSLDGVNEVPGADYSETPSVEGYFEKDLDVRLSLESTVGLFRRSVERTQSDLSGTSTEESESYVVPMFTTLKFYPVRHDARKISPYVSAGIGFALGLNKTDTTGGAFSGLEEGSSTHTGYGYNAGTGLDWNAGKSMGVTFNARYQNLRFDQEMSGERYFKGIVIAAGATYRFQRSK